MQGFSSQIHSPAPNFRETIPDEKSEEIFGHDRILFSTGKGAGLVHDCVVITLEPVGVTVRANVHLAGHDGVAPHTDLIKAGVFDDTTGPLGTFS